MAAETSWHRYGTKLRHCHHNVLLVLMTSYRKQKAPEPVTSRSPVGYVQGRRHDFKSEGDKTWFCSPTFGKVGGTIFFPRGGTSKQIERERERVFICLTI